MGRVGVASGGPLAHHHTTLHYSPSPVSGGLAAQLHRSPHDPSEPLVTFDKQARNSKLETRNKTPPPSIHPSASASTRQSNEGLGLPAYMPRAPWRDSSPSPPPPPIPGLAGALRNQRIRQYRSQESQHRGRQSVTHSLSQAVSHSQSVCRQSARVV